MLERLLIVGLGSIGRRHLRLVRQLVPGVEVAVFRHRAPQDTGQSGDPIVEHTVTSVEEALAFRPDAAVIANPSTLHLGVSTALARAGVHLLVEKPIADTTDGVSQLIEICHAGAVTLMTGYNLRFLPSLQRFQAMLAADRVGRVLSVRAEVGQFLPAWRPDTDYRRGVSANASLGGGVLLELSHEIEYLRWLFGDVAWVSAIERRQSDLEIDVEDTALLLLGFAGDAAARPVIASLNMDCVRHDRTRTCTAIGETGSLRWNGLTGIIDVFDRSADGWAVVFDETSEPDASYIAEWRHFLGCIEEGVVPLVSGVDGLAVLRIVEAARRSSATGAVVRVEQDSAVA